ncbi:NAD(P)/FAD-dependent oxidoreductase [Rhodotorula paludigena]|uniref:NAD(P)/FAD-dependent oxidoreductase n=1 Tax=Rhodotorula paludigena TaxID=86838 RepID=UPI0031727EEC
MLSKSESIIVVGAGTFGLSTAWHLARAGYTDVTVIDRHDAPSIASAGNDLNKIFRTEYAEEAYTRLAKEAREVWLNEPVLRGCYHESGYIFAVCGRSPPSVANYEAAVSNSRARGVEFELLESPEAFRAKAPVLTGEMCGWRGVYNPKAGWTHARNSLQALTDECKRLGVKFVSGGAGAVKSFKLWCYAHITLSDEEAKQYRDMPVINNRELGYLFEPDLELNRLKVCPHTTGWTHFVDPLCTRSVPRSKAIHPTDTIPKQAEDEIRAFLSECMPNLANRPFSYSAMCWDADSPSGGHFLIDRHPELPNLIVAGGASAHAFKFLPTIGAQIKDLLEDKLDPELASLWRWRPGSERIEDTSRPSKPVLDIGNLEGWRHEANL